MVQPRAILCGDWECLAALTIDDELVDDLADCYGWNPVTGWPEGTTPQGVIDWCDPTLTGFDCVIVDAFSTSSTGIDLDTCPSGCAEGKKNDLPPSECCRTEAEIEALESSQPEFNDLLEQINDDCNLGLQTMGSISCVDNAPEYRLDDACPTSSVASTPGADYLWEVDEFASTLTVHTTAGEDTVSLSGLGAAQTGPNEFLAGIVDFEEDLDLGSDSYTDGRFWFTADILMSSGGGNTFTVPATQSYQIRARGTKNGTWYNAIFEPTEDAQGTFNAGTGSWSLDYYSTFSGGWVDLHLEGAAYGTSVP